MIRHVFSWRVAEGHTTDEVVEVLETLNGTLPHTKTWELGVHQGDPGENGNPFDGVLINDFESWEDLNAYSVDPFHADVVEKLAPLLSDKVVVDFVREEN